MTKRFKVLHVYKSALPYGMGGVEQTIHNIAVGCLSFDIDSVVLCLAPKGQPRGESFFGYQVFPAHCNFEFASTGFSLQALSLFRKLSEEVDLIHYHFPWPFMDLMEFLICPKKPKLVTYHSDVVRQKRLLRFYSPFMMHFLSRANRIVATSPNYLNTSPVLRNLNQRCEVIALGVGEELLQLKSNYEDCERFIEHYAGGFFLFVGALRYYKGLHVLVEAAALNGLPVVIAGAGPTERELRSLISSLGVKNVVLTSAVSDQTKATLLKASLAVVFPSHLRSEAFGVTLIEGAMFSKPLISSEIGTGTTYVNIHEETGLVVRPGDALDLSNAMQRIWEDRIFAAELGKASRLRYEKLFKREFMVKQYVDLYGRLSRGACIEVR